MNLAKLKAFAGACGCLLLAFSVSANAAGIDQLDSGISIESWLTESGREIPVLSFDKTLTHEELAEDIRLENIIQDKDGSVRFQLSHSGPLSRQVFANVRRVEQDNGFTRSIITNIADGSQTEYLTRTSEVTSVSQLDKTGASGLLAESGFIDDQHVECPWCYFAGWLITEAACAATAALAHHQCRLSCRRLGGVKSFDSGICGSIYSECLCWIAPRRIAREF